MSASSGQPFVRDIPDTEATTGNSKRTDGGSDRPVSTGRWKLPPQGGYGGWQHTRGGRRWKPVEGRWKVPVEDRR